MSEKEQARAIPPLRTSNGALSSTPTPRDRVQMDPGDDEIEGTPTQESEAEEELRREQEQARACQLLSAPREVLSSILAPRDLIDAGVHMDLGDNKIERTPSGHRVLSVKKRLRSLRALPRVGNHNEVTVRKPVVIYHAINTTNRLVCGSAKREERGALPDESTTKASTHDQSPGHAGDLLRGLESENAKLRSKIQKLQRSLELCRGSYDLAVGASSLPRHIICLPLTCVILDGGNIHARMLARAHTYTCKTSSCHQYQPQQCRSRHNAIHLQLY